MQRKWQILVVDDEPDIRLMLRVMLGNEGWSVSEADCGAEAIRMYREIRPDLVVLDHKMPDLTGIETAARLREGCFHGPILLFSAYVDQKIEAAAATFGLVVIDKSDPMQLPRQIRLQLEER